MAKYNFFVCKCDKNGILTSNNSDYLLSNDVRRINAWLTSPQYPKLFRFIDDEYFSEQIEFFATITEVNTEHTSLPYDLTFQVHFLHHQQCLHVL